MYQLVLAAALATSAAAPNHCFFRSCYSYGCGGCYAGYGGCAGYAGYAGYAPYCSGCYSGPYVNPVMGYGCAGGCYGYHGGCYGGFGVFTGEPFGYGCTGCYGCYGGYAGYGVPVPIQAPDARDRRNVDPYPPINPDVKKKPTEEVAPPKEKKKDVKDTKDDARGTIRMMIPDGAKLFVDGRPIDANPGTRVFRTPVLAAGQTYYYDIRIEITRDGAIIADEHRIYVRPGEETAAVFTNIPPSVNTAAAPR